MYAITGITGQVGGAVAQHLLTAGLAVRAVIRHRNKGEPWAAKGCEVATADMTDGEALARAFMDMEGVFVLIPPLFDPEPGFPEVRAVIAALKSAIDFARPGRAVCLSTVGAQADETNLLSQLGMVEEQLGPITVPIAFLRAAWFMENTASDVRDARKTGTFPSFLQPTDRAIPMVATADIGEVAASLLQERWQGRRIVELEGPRPVSPDEIATILSGLLHRPVRPEVVPRDRWEALFRDQGARHPEMRARMIDGFNQGWIAFERETCKGGTDVAAVLASLVARG